MAVSALLALTFSFSGSARVASVIIASMADRLPLTATFWRQRKASDVRSACSVVISRVRLRISCSRISVNTAEATVNATTTANARLKRRPMRQRLRKFIDCLLRKWNTPRRPLTDLYGILSTRRRGERSRSRPEAVHLRVIGKPGWTLRSAPIRASQR